MMRKTTTSSAYTRRIQTSRREIAIAVSLTLAALVLTIAALWSGTPQSILDSSAPAKNQSSN